MATKSAQKAIDLSQVLGALAAGMNKQNELLASLVTTQTAKPTTEKPAPTKVVAAAKGVPEVSVTSYAGKHGNGLLIKFGSAKWGLMIYPEQWELIKRHAAEINNAFAKLPK
jgi:hypothetical protein